MAVVTAACLGITGFAQDVEITDTFLVGRGYWDNDIIINLEGRKSVQESFYVLTSPIPAEYPDYKIEMNYDTGENLDIHVIYDEPMGMYQVTITAKEVTDADLVLGVYKRDGGRRYIMVDHRNIKLKVIDGDECQDDDDRDDIEDLQSDARKIDFQGALDFTGEDGVIGMDISKDGKLTVGWLKMIQQYPEATLKLRGENFIWSLKGSDVKGFGTALNYMLNVVQGGGLAAAQQAAGTQNIVSYQVSGLEGLYVTGRLEVNADKFAGKTVDVYLLKGGKSAPVLQNANVGKNGELSFPVSQDGCYYVTEQVVSVVS